MRELTRRGPQQEEIFQGCRDHAMPFRCNHNKAVAGIELCFECGKVRPLRAVAPQALIPQGQGGFAQIQGPGV